jgi:hypothetical protein
MHSLGWAGQQASRCTSALALKRLACTNWLKGSYVPAHLFTPVPASLLTQPLCYSPPLPLTAHESSQNLSMCSSCKA